MCINYQDPSLFNSVIAIKINTFAANFKLKCLSCKCQNFHPVQNTFYADLKKRINTYFDQSGKDMTGNFRAVSESSSIGNQLYRIIYTSGLFYATGLVVYYWNVSYSDV